MALGTAVAVGKVLDFPFLTHPLRKREHEAAFGAGWRWSSYAAEVCCAQRGLNPKLHPISSRQPAKACEHLHTELNLEDLTQEGGSTGSFRAG